MKKSLVLALALVLGVASVSMAATPSFSGNVTLEAASEDSFTGPFKITPKARVDMNISESGENWSLEARVRAEMVDLFPLDYMLESLTGSLVKSNQFSVALNRYKGVLEAGPVTATISRDYDLGSVNTPFKWISLPGKASVKVPAPTLDEPDATKSVATDQLRLSTSVSGVTIDSQIQRELDLEAFLEAVQDAVEAYLSGDIVEDELLDAVDNVLSVRNLRARIETQVQNFTVGAGLRIGLGEGDKSDYAVYGTTKVGIAELKAIYGSFSGTGNYAVDVGAQVTDALNIGATYSDVTRGDTTKGYAVRATFTEGLLYAKATHAEENKKTGLWFKYRGSEENVAFDDLFEGDYDDVWYENVAPAFGVNYQTAENTKDTITLYGVAPLTSTAIGRAKVTTSDGDTQFNVEARFSLSEKLVFNPFANQAIAEDETELGAKLIYSVSDNSEISVTAKQKGDKQSLTAAYSIDF